MDVDANQYQDAKEIVDVDADADVILDLSLAETDSVETIAVYGSSFFSSSVEDVAVIHSAVMDVVVMTVVSGSFFFSSSVEDAAIIHAVTIHVVTTVADATIAAANKRIDEDGYDRPFCISIFYFISYS